MATKLDMTQYFENTKKVLRERIKGLQNKPTLLVLTDGVDPKCQAYMRSKVNIGKELGVDVKIHILKDEKDLKSVLDYCFVSKTPTIMQLPIKKELESIYREFEYVKEIDVDGFFHIQEVSEGDYTIAPATPKGIVTWLKATNNSLRQKTIAVVGRGNLVGKPLVQMLMNEGATVLNINSKTPKYTKEKLLELAHVVILATGVKGSVSTDDLLSYTMVVNVGTCFDSKGKLTTELEVCSDDKHDGITYTPRINGVGILTVLTLMENVVNYYEK